jgi:hypothetical protein
MKTLVLLFPVAIILLNIKSILTHFCGINLLNKPKRVLVPQENESMRSLKEESWEPLRIHLDFSLIENNLGKFDKQDLIDLRDKIMPKTKEVFEKLLKVKRVASKLKLPAESCDSIKVPEYLTQDGVDADIVIFVKIDDTGFFKQNHVEAAAIHCFQDDVSRRPIAGYIEFKPELKVTNQTAVDYMTWLAIHEITHILVMNDSLYDDWIDTNMKPLGFNNVVGNKILPNGKKMSFLKTPQILVKGKEHFGCDKFEGLALEYNGGPGTAGAHWSKKVMNTDYMIGDSYGENLISELSLAMFDDSGWYKVDYNLSNLFLWGKGQGCEFLDHKIKCVSQGPEKHTTHNDTSSQKNSTASRESSSFSMKLSSTVTTKFKNNFCTKLNYPICSTGNIFRGNCRTRRYKYLFPYEQYFNEPNVGGVDWLTDKCPIPIEMKQGQGYYGGSCRVGQSKTINKFEKVCPECACFMSNLKENHPEESKPTPQKRLRQETLLAPENYNPEIVFRLKAIETPSNVTNTHTSPNPVVEKNFTVSSNHTDYSVSVNITENNSTSSTEQVVTIASLKKAVALQKDPLPELTDEDFRAYCFEYKCEQEVLYVKVLDKAYKCEEKPITIEGYKGIIQCPPASVLCDSKYKCKFGCTDKYRNQDYQ